MWKRHSAPFLELEKAYQEIQRTLKPNGRAIFFEPLGHNPIINLYRYLTPKMRTEDEHPLLMKDFRLARDYFNRIKIEYYTLFSIVSTFFPAFSAILNKLDSYLFENISILRKYAWITVTEFSEPR